MPQRLSVLIAFVSTWAESLRHFFGTRGRDNGQFLLKWHFCFTNRALGGGRSYGPLLIASPSVELPYKQFLGLRVTEPAPHGVEPLCYDWEPERGRKPPTPQLAWSWDAWKMLVTWTTTGDIITLQLDVGGTVCPIPLAFGHTCSQWNIHHAEWKDCGRGSMSWVKRHRLLLSIQN